ISGKADGAYQFDGIDSNVNFGSEVGNFGTNDFTISYWINTTTTGFEAILAKRPVCNGSANSWHFRIGGPGVGSGNLSIELGRDTDLSTFNSFAVLNPINDGVWHHVLLVRNTTN